MPHPMSPLPEVDFSKLRALIENGMRQLAESGYSKDLREYVFEEAMEAVYGEGFWKWISINDIEVD